MLVYGKIFQQFQTPNMESTSQNERIFQLNIPLPESEYNRFNDLVKKLGKTSTETLSYLLGSFRVSKKTRARCEKFFKNYRPKSQPSKLSDEKKLGILLDLAERKVKPQKKARSIKEIPERPIESPDMDFGIYGDALWNQECEGCQITLDEPAPSTAASVPVQNPKPKPKPLRNPIFDDMPVLLELDSSSSKSRPIPVSELYLREEHAYFDSSR